MACCIGFPPLNTIIVGMLITPYFEAMNGASSTFNLANSIFPLSSLAHSSMTGATALHGPHQGAQKSTSTGICEFKTAFSKLFWSTLIMFSAISISLLNTLFGKCNITFLPARLWHLPYSYYYQCSYC